MKLYKSTHQAEVLVTIKVGLAQEIGYDSPKSQINRVLNEVRKLGDKHWCEIETENIEAFDVDTIRENVPDRATDLDYEEQIGRDAFLAFRRAVMTADRAFQQDGAAGTKTWMRDYLFPELDKEGVLLTLKTCDNPTAKGS